MATSRPRETRGTALALAASEMVKSHKINVMHPTPQKKNVWDSNGILMGFDGFSWDDNPLHGIYPLVMTNI